MSQLSYSQNTSAGIAGGKVFTNQAETIVTYNNPADEILFGTYVQKVVGDDNGCERFDSPNAEGLGIAILDQTVAQDVATVDNAYPVEYPVAVASLGVFWGRVNDDVTPDDDVYVKFCDTLAVQTITFDRDFEASNSIAWTVNGVSGTAVVYATSHAATIAALAAAVQEATGVLTCTAATRTLTITSENADQPTLTFTVTGGANQAVDAAPVVTVAGVEGVEQGYFRADSDSNTAALVSGLKFLNSASDGGLVQLKLS